MRSSAPPSHLPSCLVFLMGLLSLFALKTRAVFPALQSLAARLGFRPKRVAPSGLPHLDIVEQVSKATVRVLGMNPGPYTLQGTNTYLIGTGADKILVDTGEEETADAYVSQLFDFVFPATGTIGLTHILVTHGHSDHQGGVRRVLLECGRRGLPMPAVFKHCPRGDSFPMTSGIACTDMEDGQVFTTEGASLRVLLTPGHCSDHASLVMQEDGAILSGDCVLGCGSTVFEDLGVYMKSLQRLEKVIRTGVVVGLGATAMTIPLDNIYPGHGPIIRGAGLAKVQEYIRHRELREKQILAALKTAADKSGWCSSWTLMREVYRDASPALPLLIQAAAQGSTVHHLEKLEQDGAVESRWPDLWRLKA